MNSKTYQVTRVASSNKKGTSSRKKDNHLFSNPNFCSLLETSKKKMRRDDRPLFAKSPNKDKKKQVASRIQNKKLNRSIYSVLSLDPAPNPQKITIWFPLVFLPVFPTQGEYLSPNSWRIIPALNVMQLWFIVITTQIALQNTDFQHWWSITRTTNCLIDKSPISTISRYCLHSLFSHFSLGFRTVKTWGGRIGTRASRVICCTSCLQRRWSPRCRGRDSQKRRSWLRKRSKWKMERSDRQKSRRMRPRTSLKTSVKAS